MKKKNISKKELHYLYKVKNLTTYEIAKIYNCCQGTIWKKLKEYHMRCLPNGRRTFVIAKSKLRDLYINKRLSSRKIAKIYNCAYSTIDNKIKRYGFLTRNRAESHIIYPRTNFKGDKIHKAYLVGFSTGDLRARKLYPNSETIKIDCGSTRKEQINLISNLFNPYGRVWISKPNRRSVVQIECFLNMTFDFLLKKRDKIDKWILENDKYFIAFLAGFTDAEGSIHITRNGMAVYSLGNYNNKILSQIRTKLIQLGINCTKIRKDNNKGYVSKEGYKRKQDYFHLSICRKFYLIQLFYLISNYLKHSKRVKDMKKAIKNIELRNKKYGNINMNL